MAKRYIENNLSPNEYVVLEAKISWLTLVLPTIWLALNLAFDLFVFDKYLDGWVAGNEQLEAWLMLFEVIFIFIEFGPLVYRIMTNRSTCLAVTNKRVMGKKGVFRVQSIDLYIGRVSSVSYHANFFGHIFHYYRVEVRSSGTASRTPLMPGISNAKEFKNAVSEASSLNTKHNREEQARLIGEAIVEAMRRSTIQLMAQPPIRPAPTIEGIDEDDLEEDLAPDDDDYEDEDGEEI